MLSLLKCSKVELLVVIRVPYTTHHRMMQVVNFTSLIQECHHIPSSLLASLLKLRRVCKNQMQLDICRLVVEKTCIKLVDKKC